MKYITKAMKPSQAMCPDFFIPGFPKCATFSLYHALNQHPRINMGQFKEPLTFLRDYHWADIDKVYQETYSYTNNPVFDEPIQLHGDCNTNNATALYVPEKIKIMNPHAKIIFMIRPPAEQVYSRWYYNRHLRPGFENREFDELVDQCLNTPIELDRFELEQDYVPTMCKRWGNYHRQYLETACYEHYISHWEKVFSPKQIMVIDYRRYIKHPNIVHKEIHRFLGVPPKDMPTTPRNKSKRKSTIYDETFKLEHERLKEFYNSHNAELALKRKIYF